jgi:hypothetical protein
MPNKRRLPLTAIWVRPIFWANSRSDDMPKSRISFVVHLFLAAMILIFPEHIPRQVQQEQTEMAETCLSLDRQEFSNRLARRGWAYNSKTHLWSKGENRTEGQGELALFGS